MPLVTNRGGPDCARVEESQLPPTGATATFVLILTETKHLLTRHLFRFVNMLPRVDPLNPVT
jgi:hypothetical protein